MRGWLVKALGLSIAAVLLFPAAAPPAAANGSSVEYLRLAYDGSIWEVSSDGIYELSWEEWRDLGFPAWRNALTEYVKYPWSPSISAVTYFGSDPREWLWDRLDFGMWSAAGRPAPRNAGWIGGSTIHQWSTSSELFLTDPSGHVHKLSYPEWSDTGFHPFEYIANQGYVTLGWDSTGNIAGMCDMSMGRGSRVTYDEWRRAGSPTPQVVSSLPRAYFWWWGGPSAGSLAGSSTIFYESATGSLALSYAQWTAFGQPAPTGGRNPSNPYSC